LGARQHRLPYKKKIGWAQIKKPPHRRLFHFFYCPETSSPESTPSPVPAGALHATAAVLYEAQAEFLELSQVWRAVFIEASNVVHAAFTAAFIVGVVVWVEYAACNADALALYAEFMEEVYVVIAESIATSLAFTATPTQAILVVASVMGFDVPGVVVGKRLILLFSPACPLKTLNWAISWAIFACSSDSVAAFATLAEHRTTAAKIAIIKKDLVFMIFYEIRDITICESSQIEYAVDSAILFLYTSIILPLPLQ
jgi:hypothetical protein